MHCSHLWCLETYFFFLIHSRTRTDPRHYKLFFIPPTYNHVVRKRNSTPSNWMGGDQVSYVIYTLKQKQICGKVCSSTVSKSTYVLYIYILLSQRLKRSANALLVVRKRFWENGYIIEMRRANGSDRGHDNGSLCDEAAHTSVRKTLVPSSRARKTKNRVRHGFCCRQFEEDTSLSHRRGLTEHICFIIWSIAQMKNEKVPLWCAKTRDKNPIPKRRRRRPPPPSQRVRGSRSAFWTQKN